MRPSVSARPAHKSAWGQPQTPTYTLAGSLRIAVTLGATLHVPPCRSWDRSPVMALRCLIVDDNTGFRDEMQALLEAQGISVGGGPRAGLRRSAKSVTAGRTSSDPHRPHWRVRGAALPERLGEGDGVAVVPHMSLISTHDEREYADLIEASPAVGFLARQSCRRRTAMLAVSMGAHRFVSEPHSRHNAANRRAPTAPDPITRCYRAITHRI